MKKIMILLGMLILMIGLSSIVSADTAPTCTFIYPLSNTHHNGTIRFNATIDTEGIGDFNITGINYTVAGAVVGSDVTGINSSYYNSSVDTNTITDVRQTTVTANIIINTTNSGKYYGSCTVTGVDFDNSDPVCSDLVLDFSILEILSPLTVTCEASDTTDKIIAVTICTADNVCTTETQASSTSTIFNPTFEGTETGDLGTLTAGCIVTDELARTCTPTNLTVTVKGDGDAVVSGVTKALGDEEEDKSPVLLIVIIALVAVVVLIVAFSLTKKKKKR